MDPRSGVNIILSTTVLWKLLDTRLPLTRLSADMSSQQKKFFSKEYQTHTLSVGLGRD